ncbi:hypothetical protein ARMSODRAFT_1025423 [Armillaria solidipes]|uniref:F-box domain-containing protein n=1 Tax=Armillaria solidipes TaxID=1076256 RepID=A0A2H3ASD6_9AGAR|nr:hypothetical protein ARMSODRAFT_1025423 [Armillaria solidipes]
MLVPEIMSPLGDEYLIPAHISMYLENNDVPHDGDIAESTKFLWDIDQCLKKADEDAKEPSGDIETLQKRRAALLETQSRLRFILSPLRRFPTEILFEIFQRTIERRGYSVLDTSDGPWSLSRVSRHWRATTLTCSGALWSKLYIGVYMYSFHRSNPLPLLRTCLARSRRHNISVFFDYLVPTFEDKDKEMVHLLIDNCERWHSLEISNHCLEIHDLLGKVRGRVPNLKSLVIRCEPARASPLTAFEFAPQLRTVKIHDGVGVVLGPGNPSLILYEDYRRSPPRDRLDSYFTILRSCHDLQTFIKLHAYPAHMRSDAEKHPIVLPELRHFQGSHRDLIQRVTTPNLESFHLDMFFPIRSFYDNLLLNVRDLFIRSRCQGLSNLTLSNAVTSRILDILPLLPGLAVLEFRFSGWRDGGIEEDIFRSMFQQMADVDDVGMLKVVPNLREFSFRVAQRHLSCILCLDGIFLDMVASRAKTLEKVEAVGTVPSDIWSSKQVSVFEGLLKEGMDISLNSFRPWDFSGGLDDSIIADHCVKSTWPRHISTLVRSP